MEITHNVLKETAAAQAQRQSKPTEVSTSSTGNLNDAVSKVQSQTLADDIYTASEHIPSVTYDKPLTVTERDPAANLLLDKMTNTISFGELPKKLIYVKPMYEKMMGEIAIEQPSLANKDWGFSVDENDKLVVSGDVTEDEKAYLEEKLNSNDDIVRLTKDIPEIFMKGQEYDRGYFENEQGRFWGKYDVTKENFKDIVDIKALLESRAQATDPFSFADDFMAQLARNADIIPSKSLKVTYELNGGK
ncbi:hypothetical protein GCM10008107_00340 [Psychrosphaera saromensis]|uniref:Uncharacterized protein n=1 Tax=Psychrosphaera saromensis TaxID=716813 RepID=A0A2S7UZ25_9GAMM|nr:hypothetical protein [Psychrosphaera saromensis]PQJ54988.1 hypothetical protein BTO11_15880 [Psychrosphaera saromensis]GHB55570.1 hypothetical protein GCM10008107_00340 [Psychrosphaera saromensis]GLQ13756.1 hypothetical protein GCM10007917_12110 [Psychrosphaera saromensis]